MIPNPFARRPPANLGRAGERLAARWLRQRGYRTLARNLRVHLGEADLVCLAPDRRTIVIVEVKTRRARPGDGFAPETAVGAAKARKLTQIAAAVAAQNNWTDRPLRIDVVAITWPDRQKPKIRWIPNAVSAS